MSSCVDERVFSLHPFRVARFFDILNAICNQIIEAFDSRIQTHNITIKWGLTNYHHGLCNGTSRVLYKICILEKDRAH